MIRKQGVLLVSLAFMVWSASAGFYVIEDGGERRQVAPVPQASDKAKLNANPSIEPESLSSDGEESETGFLSLGGGVMGGALDMGGFSLTGLPEPEEPSDAATKAYVDSETSNLSSGNRVINRTVVNRTVVNRTTVNKTVYEGGDGSSGGVPTLSEVLSSGSAISQPISFASGIVFGEGASAEAGGIAVGRNSDSSGDGVSLGWKSEAEQGSVALGRSAEATGENSAAIGKNVEASEDDTFVVGDENTTVRVPGELEAQDEGGGVEYRTFSVNATPNGTRVEVPQKIGDYGVSATPVDSLAEVGIFNRTSSGFEARSSEKTRADILVVESEN